MITYSRILPRDLFNEAKLLKCLGRVTLAIENGWFPLEYKYNGGPFDIQQNSDGDLTCLNVTFDKGLTFYKPLNSKKSWPLVCVTNEYEYIEVFEEEDDYCVLSFGGIFTEEFIEFIKMLKNK